MEQLGVSSSLTSGVGTVPEEIGSTRCTCTETSSCCSSQGCLYTISGESHKFYPISQRLTVKLQSRDPYGQCLTALSPDTLLNTRMALWALLSLLKLCFQVRVLPLLPHPKKTTFWFHPSGGATLVLSNVNNSSDVHHLKLKKHNFSQTSSKKKSAKPSKIACPQCGVRVLEKGINRHISVVHDKITTQCPQCNKTVGYTQLNEHIRTVHDNETAQCPECNKILKYSSLKTHISRVHGKKKAQCLLCNKTVSRLGQHIRHVHDKEKVKCPHCNKTLSFTSLNRHIRSVHKLSNASEELKSSLWTVAWISFFFHVIWFNWDSLFVPSLYHIMLFIRVFR